MTEALDKILAAHDHIDRVKYFLRATVGLSEAAAADTAAAQSEKFKFDSGVLSFMGKPADRDGFVAWAKDTERAYLLPPEFANNKTTNDDQPAAKPPKNVDPALLSAAKDGDWTSKGLLVRQHGLDAVDALLIGTKGDTDVDKERRARARLVAARDAAHPALDAPAGNRDAQGRFVADDALAKSHKGVNPWSAEGWNATEQSRIFRANSKLASSLAAAANSHIGAARPFGSKPATIVRAFSGGRD